MSEKPTERSRIIDIVADDAAGHLAGSFPVGLMPGDSDYVGWFSNIHGEEMVFVQREGERTGTLIHSDIGWKPYEVRRGRCHELILDESEREWLVACWRASAWYRPHHAADIGPDLSPDVVMPLMSGEHEEEIKKLTYAALDAGEGAVLMRMAGRSDIEEDRCAHCGERIAKNLSTRTKAWVHTEGLAIGCAAASGDRHPEGEHGPQAGQVLEGQARVVTIRPAADPRCRPAARSAAAPHALRSLLSAAAQPTARRRRRG